MSRLKPWSFKPRVIQSFFHAYDFVELAKPRTVTGSWPRPMKKEHSLDCLRILRGTVFPVCICLLISCHPWFWAQSPADKKSGETADLQNTVLPLNLRYDEPKTYAVGTKQSVVIADFGCGGDGTVFLPMLADHTAWMNEANHTGPRVDRMHGILVTALTPSGDVVRFAPVEIAGLRNFFPERRYFVSSTRVYTLEAAEMYDPADPG